MTRDTALMDEADRCEDVDIDPRMERLEWPQQLRLLAAIDGQATMLRLMAAMDYPVDEAGRTHDLSAMAISGSIRALAYCLTMQGVRFDEGKRLWKRRAADRTVGVYENACTYVDVDAPETAGEDLQPTDREHDFLRPPDVRGLAAVRDGFGPTVTAQWHVTPEVRETFEPRIEDDE